MALSEAEWTPEWPITKLCDPHVLPGKFYDLGEITIVGDGVLTWHTLPLYDERLVIFRRAVIEFADDQLNQQIELACRYRGLDSPFLHLSQCDIANALYVYRHLQSMREPQQIWGREIRMNSSFHDVDDDIVFAAYDAGLESHPSLPVLIEAERFALVARIIRSRPYTVDLVAPQIDNLRYPPTASMQDLVPILITYPKFNLIVTTPHQNRVDAAVAVNRTIFNDTADHVRQRRLLLFVVAVTDGTLQLANGGIPKLPPSWAACSRLDAAQIERAGKMVFFYIASCLPPELQVRLVKIAMPLADATKKTNVVLRLNWADLHWLRYFFDSHNTTCQNHASDLRGRAGST